MGKVGEPIGSTPPVVKGQKVAKQQSFPSGNPCNGWERG